MFKKDLIKKTENLEMQGIEHKHSQIILHPSSLFLSGEAGHLEPIPPVFGERGYTLD